MPDFRISSTEKQDHTWVENLISKRWGASSVVAHGEVFYPAELPGFIAWKKAEPCGLVTYTIQANTCEIITLDALRPSQGIGGLLINAVKKKAIASGCTRLWLITTNDNTSALAFYQKHGFRLAALHAGAIERSRRIKPQIPLVGENDIPIRDEIELEMDL